MTKDLDQIIESAKTEAQKDAFRDFFIKNSKKIIIFSSLVAFLTVIAVALFLIKSHQEKYYSEILHKSYVAQNLADYDEAKKLLKKIIDSKFSPKSISSLAVLRYCSLILEDGKNSEAFDLYLKMANCKSCDSFIQELSQLFAIKLWFMDEEIQKKNKSFINSIEIYAFRSKFLKNHINEQLALIEKSNGELQKSYDLFKQIVENSEKSSGINVRAQTALSELYPDIKKDENDAK